MFFLIRRQIYDKNLIHTYPNADPPTCEIKPLKFEGSTEKTFFRVM